MAPTLAPSAVRTAISLRRRVARSNKRLAAFAPPTSSTSAATVPTLRRIGRTRAV